MFLRRVSRLPVLVLAFGGMLSCGGEGTTAPLQPPPPPPPPPPAAVATSVTVTPETTAFVSLGDTVRLAARVLDQNGQVMAGERVTWTSSDAAVAKVDSAGLVAATGNGNATVTAASGQASGTATVTVEQVAAGLRVAPAADTLRALGATLQLSSAAIDANGHHVPGYEFTWSSSDVLVASVDRTGLVLAKANGSARVTAASGSWADSAAITVAQTAARIQLSPPPDTLRTYGDTVRLSAEGFDSNGHKIPAPDFLWASSDTFVVTVDPTGLVTGAGNGTTDISARSGEATDSVAVTVDDPAGAIAADRAALVALYNATGGSNWTNSHNWLTDRPLSSWSGVTTNPAGRVSELRLAVRGKSRDVPRRH